MHSYQIEELITALYEIRQAIINLTTEVKKGNAKK